MTEQPSNVAVIGETSEARFSMRALLIATAVFSLFAALVGPLIRALEPAEQSRLLAAWAVWLAATVAVVAYQARNRYRTEQRAGRTLLRLPMFDEKLGATNQVRRWLNIVGRAAISLVLLQMVSAMIVESPPGLQTQNIFSLAFFGALSVWSAARTVSMLWWRSNIRFCESGILWDRRLLRWDYILEHHWSEADRNVLEVRGIDQKNLDATWRIPVPDTKRDDVQSVLNEKASGGMKSLGPSISELGHLPVSAAVKDPHFVKFVIGIVVMVLLFAAGMYLVSTGPTGVPEFDRSVLWGFLLRVIASASLWRQAGKHAGAPLVRLTGRRGWLGLLGLVAVAICFYVAGKNYGWTSAWLAYATGIGFWWAAISIPLHLFPKQIDLRSNGVSLPGELFWHWANVKVLRWDRNRSGRLVLARGWRRIVAKVPAEQRELVDSVLKQIVSAFADSSLPSCIH